MWIFAEILDECTQFEAVDGKSGIGKPRAVDASNRRKTLTSVPRPLVQQRLETGQCQRASTSRTKDRHCTSAGEVSVVDDVPDNGIVSSDRGTAVHIALQRS